MTEFTDLKGKTITAFHITDDQLILNTRDGKSYRMWHPQDCCESVYLADICGDMMDLLNTPVVMAEEVTSTELDHPDVPEDYEPDESFTWTFYKLGTNRGSVTLRWLGESNGYYSEDVHFEEVKR